MSEVKGKDKGNVVLPAPELTPEEKKVIFTEALKAVQAELKEKESDRLRGEYEKAIRRSMVPDEIMEPILIDLAAHADRISLDGTIFFHGVTYNVSRNQAATLREIISRTWKHEADIGGANSNHYRRPKNMMLTPSETNANLSHLMRM